MPNEEIITALKNGNQQGESLQETIQTLINSGYNPQEVQEASNYIGGVLSKLSPKQEDELITPESKSIFRNIIPQGQTSPQQFQKNKDIIQQIKQNSQGNYKPLIPQKPQSNIQQPKPLSPPLTLKPLPSQYSPQQTNLPTKNQSLKIPIRKQSYTKEITLLIILILLVGILITTILFRNDILRFFSG